MSGYSSKQKERQTRRTMPKLEDQTRFLSLAQISFQKGKYSLVIDYCRQVADNALIAKWNDLALEAYYLWCLSDIKLRRFDDARKICYDARSKLGNSIEMVHIELMIAVESNDSDKILRFAQGFMELWNNLSKDDARDKTRMYDKAAEVLLIWARALEKLNNINEACKIYERYLAICPNDEIKRHMTELTNKNTNNS